jgi:hypothetical protein
MCLRLVTTSQHGWHRITYWLCIHSVPNLLRITNYNQSSPVPCLCHLPLYYLLPSNILHLEKIGCPVPAPQFICLSRECCIFASVATLPDLCECPFQTCHGQNPKSTHIHTQTITHIHTHLDTHIHTSWRTHSPIFVLGTNRSSYSR